MAAIRKLHSLDIATFLARLQDFGVCIEAGWKPVGYWKLWKPNKPDTATAIAFAGYGARLSLHQIQATLRRLEIEEEAFWGDPPDRE